ncbi:flagellar type III secretion system protein FlhB [Sedimentimonas flavescens]|uniref:flagellar type III secretion system protein FlhB n=1 Tax=Sedimentimonas flavescens TaxID=2851012 RepID=UPI001C4A5101|nr:flagellar type III secretion system protein FlhB [Sedimentimonas flavescens]MBW0158103.1 flagellar type III secretion system protein FlhB [Sedimentimonas flavescens]
MSEDDSEKEFEPTPQKLEQARRKGDLIRSAELSVAASYGGVLLLAMGLGASSLTLFGQRAMVLLDQADSLSSLVFGFSTAPVGGMIGGIVMAIAPWFALPLVLVLAALAAQRALVFVPDKIQPKLSRINPFANAAQKFGRAGLFEFAKSFVKLIVIAGILGVFLSSRIEGILAMQRTAPGISSVAAMVMLREFLALVFLIALVVGALDFLWQRAEFLRRNRMSRKELMDEMKQSEGDPHLKAQRRQKGVEIATRQMIADVKTADVVIVNPTHYAVALKWQRSSGRAPVCVAKGVDELAARIRAVAMESGVPIHSDPPTARALHAAMQVGEEIRPEHYKPVAAAIRFAEKMRRRAKGMRR